MTTKPGAVLASFRKQVTRACKLDTCDVEFTGTTNKLYCSRNCMQLASVRRLKEAKKNPPPARRPKKRTRKPKEQSWNDMLFGD